jgi:diaminopimelate decarboxylase
LIEMMLDVCAYKKGLLHVEGASVQELAQRFGTPLYVYSKSVLLRNLRQYKEAFRGISHLICFALKANSNHSLLRLLAREGAGADIVSGGELFKALHAKIHPSKIVFAGVGKRDNEIRDAIRAGILLLHVESTEELHLVNRIAGELRRKATVGLRMNPGIDARTHPHIATGLIGSKFGIPIDSAEEAYRVAASLPNLEVKGIHFHLGSQITSVIPYRKALEKILGLMRKIEEFGIKIRYVDIGGGLEAGSNRADRRLSPSVLAESLMPVLQQGTFKLLLEPGRSIVAEAGLLVTRVLYRKESMGKRFLIVDAGMNDLIRPCLYDAFHEIFPVHRRRGRKLLYDVVGPVCESADFLGKDRTFVPPEIGDPFVVLSAGAYGASMSSNYNGRLRAAEVLIEEGKTTLIRSRETRRDLLRGE